MGKRNLGKTIYKITIPKWDEYNGTLKKGHQCILLSTGFLSDAKVRSQTVAGRLLFLSCLLVAGESKRSQIEVTHESLVYQSGVKSESLESQLSQLQSFQLISYEKIPFSQDKRDEKKGKREVKGKDSSRQSAASQKTEATTATPVVQIGRDLVAVYCDAWTARYQGRPPLRPQDTKQLKSIGEQNGFERTKELLIAYLNMPESWFLQKRHDLATFFSNLTGVAQFIETGAVVTKAKLRAVEGAQNLESTIRSIREEGI